MVLMTSDVRIELLAVHQVELLAAKVSHPMTSLLYIPYIPLSRLQWQSGLRGGSRDPDTIKPPWNEVCSLNHKIAFPARVGPKVCSV